MIKLCDILPNAVAKKLRVIKMKGATASARVYCRTIESEGNERAKERKEMRAWAKESYI